MRNKAIKLRLYPTKEQERYLVQLMGACRFIYNNSLAWSKEQYEAGNKTNYYDWAHRLTELKQQEETAWLKTIDNQALQQSLMNLGTAFKNFFQRRSQGMGYPKFKSKHNHRDSAKCINVKFKDGRLTIPKLKSSIKTDGHRQLEEGWKICSATISHVPSGKWFVSILYAFEDTVLENVKPYSFLGLDYAQQGLYVDSNGNSPDLRRAYRELEDKLAKEQQKLSRKKKGSNNYEKQRIKVARVHERISNIRNNQLHQLSTEITNQYDCVVIEDLNVKEMGEQMNLGKNERDNGWGMFTVMLKYKMYDRGKFVLTVDKYYPSSQICNNCGYQWPGTKDLSIREWTCPNCGHTHLRDVNAALNLRDSGIAYFASQELGEELPVSETSTSLEEEARSFS